MLFEGFDIEKHAKLFFLAAISLPVLPIEGIFISHYVKVQGSKYGMSLNTVNTKILWDKCY
jgi:hypothetical protein